MWIDSYSSIRFSIMNNGSEDIHVESRATLNVIPQNVIKFIFIVELEISQVISIPYHPWLLKAEIFIISLRSNKILICDIQVMGMARWGVRAL